jgi:hypothetical protein
MMVKASQFMAHTAAEIYKETVKYWEALSAEKHLNRG